MQSFKKSLNFRLNLARSREQMLLKDHFKKFNATEAEMPAEVSELRALLESRDQEVEDLRK